jgi:hypothetical protein
VTLTIPNSLKVFTAPTGGSQVNSGVSFPASNLPVRVWVEGEQVSTSLMDSKLTAQINGSGPSASVAFTVLWATVSIQTTGTTPPNAVQFGTLYDGTENLGAKLYANGTVGVGKVVPIAQLAPKGIGQVLTNGWAFIDSCIIQ